MLELLNEEDKKNAFVEDEVCVCVAHWSLVVYHTPVTVINNNRLFE